MIELKRIVFSEVVVIRLFKWGTHEEFLASESRALYVPSSDFN